MLENEELRTVDFVDEDGENEELTVLCQTKLAGVSYLLVSDAEIEDLEDDDVYAHLEMTFQSHTL